MILLLNGHYLKLILNFGFWSGPLNLEIDPEFLL
jgi:hypothetical protein